jgi:hypothetical protein
MLHLGFLSSDWLLGCDAVWSGRCSQKSNPSAQQTVRRYQADLLASYPGRSKLWDPQTHLKLSYIRAEKSVKILHFRVKLRKSFQRTGHIWKRDMLWLVHLWPLFRYPSWSLGILQNIEMQLYIAAWPTSVGDTNSAKVVQYCETSNIIAVQFPVTLKFRLNKAYTYCIHHGYKRASSLVSDVDRYVIVMNTVECILIRWWDIQIYRFLLFAEDRIRKTVVCTMNASYPRYKPWRPIGLRDVKDPTLSRQSVHS